MSGDGTDVELVYEPPFGPVGGPITPEDNVIVEKPIGIYVPTEPTKKYIQDLLDKQGKDLEVKEIIGVVDPQRKLLGDQLLAAIGLATTKLMEEPDFPRVRERTTLDDKGSYREDEFIPLTTDKLQLNKIEKESGITINGDCIVLSKKRGLNDTDYVRARKAVVDEANKILNLFEVKDKIPTFPPPEEMAKI